MKVSKLIELLQKEDPDRLVILQKDSEGNGYSSLSGVDTGAYVPDSTWSGEVHLEKLTPEREKAGYTEEDVAPPGFKKAVILFPVN